MLGIGVHTEAAEVWRPEWREWMQAVPEAPFDMQPRIRDLHSFIAITNWTTFEQEQDHNDVVARCQGHHGARRHDCCASRTRAKEAKTFRNQETEYV